MQTKVKMGQVTVNWDNLSEEMYVFITSNLKEVSQQLKLSFLGYLKNFQVQVHYLLLKFDMKRRDLN